MPPPVSSPAALPPAVRELVGDFRRDYGDVRVWLPDDDGWRLDGADAAVAGVAPGPHAVEVGGTGWRVELPGQPPDEARAVGRLFASMAERVLRHEREITDVTREIAERYEEITLLYTISEILGSVISLERAAETILREVTAVLGAVRGALWVCEPGARELSLAAAVGGKGQDGPISVDDDCSVTAAVYRDARALILGPDDEFPRGDCQPIIPPRGSFLSVPVRYTPPDGETRTVGVINLIGRTSGEAFTAGDLKLLSAIASQVGAAVENNRLVAERLRQQRIERELELAHDLQLKLLPPLEQFEGYARVAARCVPAESVGGDFFHLFRLPPDRLGVLIGDVSGHGFGAALIMAMTMGAVAIHASEGDPPAEVLRRTHHALIDELETTEMYLTLFYGVVDPGAGTLTYANAGHPHAFRVDAAGEARRLEATALPFGVVDVDRYDEARVEWRAGEDLLFLFTDGLSDALEAGETGGERVLLDEVVRRRDAAPAAILDALFARVGDPSGLPADDRTALLVGL